MRTTQLCAHSDTARFLTGLVQCLLIDMDLSDLIESRMLLSRRIEYTVRRPCAADIASGPFEEFGQRHLTRL